MSNKKLTKNKSGEKFGFGVFIVFLAISISLFSFISEENKITGLVTLEEIPQNIVRTSDLRDFKDVNSLSSLAAGNYYVDERGVVYWVDDESGPAVGQLNIVEESQKERHIYIDSNGRIGYVLDAALINEK